MALVPVPPQFSSLGCSDTRPKGLYIILYVHLYILLLRCHELFALLGRRGERCDTVSAMCAKQTSVHFLALRQLPSAFSSSTAGLSFSVDFNNCIFLF